MVRLEKPEKSMKPLGLFSDCWSRRSIGWVPIGGQLLYFTFTLPLPFLALGTTGLLSFLGGRIYPSLEGKRIVSYMSCKPGISGMVTY